ncbi:hypothetical protein F3Y22_tig00005411pilonHSYRG00035 [Hibiscus syriacus]|uniref:Cytochrome P450 n=1 Tax=Hibiscus syriacus TaxID=106335 RepID=A0A6A3CGB3_HIBSY|nr:hypothetical protein F3Y22_tig00005411pilonHSYRG00035 [Hibiscus syriacus]
MDVLQIQGESAIAARPSRPPLVGSFPYLRPDLHSYFAELARTYGPVVKLQLGSTLGILVTSPSAARKVLKDQDIVFANRDVPMTAMVLTGCRDIAYEVRRREVRQTHRQGGGEGERWCRAQAVISEQLSFWLCQIFRIFFPALSPLDLQVEGRRRFQDSIDNGAYQSLARVLTGWIGQDMVVGGSDTSSNLIEFLMAEIMNKPEVMRKAQQELDEVVGKDNLVEESHIHKLPYLLTIMKESLRLHPALPLLIPHCPSESCTVGGYAIPMVLYSVATLLHSFDWKVPEGNNLDLTEKFGIVFKLENALVAIPTPRLLDPTLYE